MSWSVSLPRAIVHLDADAFFASVEQAADPRLRGKPVAVGGEHRGIIASASYEARRFGIYTPMPTARARRLCPKLIVLPGDFERYEQFSRWMFQYCYDFTPDVEQTSIDEGYFDLTANRQKAPVEIAFTIRQAIAQSLKISVSEGIATNKLVSQIASKLHKPAALREVPDGQEKLFLQPLPNCWLPGVGPKLAGRLNAAGLAEIRHIAATPLDLLELLLGRQALQLRQFANGIDERPLVPARAPAQSFSRQETFGQDLADEEYVEAVLRRMADRLFATAREEGKSVRTLTIKIRYNDMAEDQCSDSLAEPTDLETDIYGRLRLMLRRAWKRRVSLRMVSLRLANVYDGRFRSGLPLDARAQHQDARARLARVIDELRRVRGDSVLLRGHDFVLRNGSSGDTTSRVEGRESRGDTGSRAESRRSKAGSIQHPASSIQHPASGIRHPASSIRHPASSIRHPAYVPLRVHSYYSFLDSTLSPQAVVDLAARYDCPAVALTDTGNLHGVVEFVHAAQKAGIRPIVGVEINVDGEPLMLYVESARGYRNLCQLLSRHAGAARDRWAERGIHAASPFALPESAAFPKPFTARETWKGPEGHAPGFTRPYPARGDARPTGVTAAKAARGDARPTGGDADSGEASVVAQERSPYCFAELEGHTEGLIAVSSQAAIAGLFPGRFYEMARPAVPCPAVHYGAPDDRPCYDILQSIRTLTLLRQGHPEKRLTGQYHFRSPAELQARCREHGDWPGRTREIADRCQFEFPFGPPQFPAFRPPDGSTPRVFLRRLVQEGLQRRYAGRRIVSDTGAVVPLSQVRAQVATELSIIAEVGYEDLFLITWDLLQTCRERGIEWITRGSAADSLVCYCLGISDVCPIRFGLYFRRFLNKERMALHKLPDIDVDFAHDRKDDVVQLLFDRYGPEHCAVVGGFSTFQTRSAVAEVAKVMGLSDFQIRRFTEHFPWSFGGSWEPADAGVHGAELLERLRASPECRDLPLEDEPFKTAVLTAAFLNGFPRHPKMHPCGVVLSRQPLAELTPTFVSNKGWPATHLDMDAVEAVGLVKMDILAQGGLAVMRDAIRMLSDAAAPHAQAVASSPIPSPSLPSMRDSRFDDPAVWELIAGGGARAVHHIESPAMLSLCRMTNVREIDGLIAIVSVIRPGAANEQKKMRFTRRYQNLEPPEYAHPSLAPCLRSTFGLVVYEEHILQICEAFAGLNPGRADVLRRALVKQQWPLVEEIAGEFAAAARARGHDDAKIREVWELVTGFHGYAFCKAHSTAYGVEAYEAAWLKCYYPAEFMAAVLTNGKGFYHPLVYVLECHRLGIPLLPPHVNHPGPEFKVERARADSPAAIRVPLTRLKGLTGKTADRLLAERNREPFASLPDFLRRVAPLPEEAEAMIRVGAFDKFGRTRTAQFWEAQQCRQAFGWSATGQGWLLPPPGLSRLPEVPLAEPTRRQCLRWEMEYFGFPVSGHPLDVYEDIAWDTYCPVSRLGEHSGREIITCGLIIEQRTHHQVTGEPMKFLTLADRTGMVETELFAAAYRNYGLATVRYPVLEVTARVEPFENGRGFSLRVLRAGKPRAAQVSCE